MKFSLTKKQMTKLNGDVPSPEFPKYTTQLINIANQNAKGTAPKVVGQLSDLFPEYQDSTGEINVEGWRKWYLERYPDTIKTATEKVFEQIQNLKAALPLIDKDMVRQWVDDLVITKTYQGLYVQRAILAKVASLKKTSYRLATPDEETQGIDGYVGDIPYSIKPITYKTMSRLPETLKGKMIYYSKNDNNSFAVEIEE